MAIKTLDPYPYPERDPDSLKMLDPDPDSMNTDPQKLKKNDVPNCREETVTLLKYLKATAFAEEYQWWPPPVFILTLTLSQLVFFAIHAVHLVQAGFAQ